MRVALDCEPDPDVAGCGNVLVPLQVDGRTMRVVLDTGALGTLLIDLPPSARPIGAHETSGLFGTETVTEWEVDELRLGSLRAGPLAIDSIADGPGRHSVVGLDLLSTGSWQLDIEACELVTDVSSSGGSPLTRNDSGRILAEMRWREVSATALWDTGAGITLLDQRFAGAHPHLFTPAGSATSIDIVGAQGEFQLAQVDSYMIDGVEFSSHIVAIVDLSAIPDRIDAVIGFPTVRQARWTVDMPVGRWRIER